MVSSQNKWLFNVSFWMILNVFHQTFLRFHSTLITLEPRNYVVARTVWTESIELVSDRLVQKLLKPA